MGGGRGLRRPASLRGGRYRIERELARGGMATVFAAHDESLGRRVAVKLLDERFALDPTFRARFVREAELAAKLAHPNVVRVFDAGEEDEIPFIVMEYVAGGSLADVLRQRGHLPADEVAAIGVQVCAGLEHAHAAGLVHRDVKPANLLLGAEGAIKIADFGVARAVEASQLTQAGTILGTVAYLSPEQAAGDAVTPKTDLYALGVVLYELLAGTPPFAAATIADLDAARRRPVRPLRELVRATPPGLERVILRCVDPVPESRPESAAEVAAELAAVGEAPTEPLPARRVSTMVLPPPPRRRRAAVVAAALAAAAVAAVAGAAALASGDDEPREPQPVEPAARGDDAADQARNLAEWLRENAEPR